MVLQKKSDPITSNIHKEGEEPLDLSISNKTRCPDYYIKNPNCFRESLTPERDVRDYETTVCRKMYYDANSRKEQDFDCAREIKREDDMSYNNDREMSSPNPSLHSHSYGANNQDYKNISSFIKQEEPTIDIKEEYLDVESTDDLPDREMRSPAHFEKERKYHPERSLIKSPHRISILNHHSEHSFNYSNRDIKPSNIFYRDREISSPLGCDRDMYSPVDYRDSEYQERDTGSPNDSDDSDHKPLNLKNSGKAYKKAMMKRYRK